MLPSPFLLLCLLAAVYAVPEVKFGRTILSGRDVSPRVDGIPFAEPPVSDLRLRPPVLKSRLNASRFDASQYGKGCVQIFADPSTLSEDYLTINVHRPKGLKSSAKLPVLFWTYGGAFVIGSSNTYNGGEIVERSVARGTPLILVNFNYRLGPLGFPQGQEADGQRALNLGALDQIAALEWVQANIESFGGDKKKVTIFGESAGAMLTGLLYMNPKHERWARGAIMESGSSNSLPAFRASCASIATTGHTFPCLRNATTEEITAGLLSSFTPDNFVSNLVSTPVLDTNPGSVYPDLSSRLYSKGRLRGFQSSLEPTLTKVIVVFSATALPQILTDQALKDGLVAVISPRSGSEDALGAAFDRVLTLYPEDPSIGSPYGTGDESFGLPASYKRQASTNEFLVISSQVVLYSIGDLVFDAPRCMLSEAAAKAGVKSFGYLFTHPQPNRSFGVAHGSEIQFVFGQVPPTGPDNLPPFLPQYGNADEAGRNVSKIMMDYWISFAVTLSPNDGKGVQRPHWPQYTPTKKVLMQLRGGNTTVIPDDYRKDQIAFLLENAAVLQH